MVYRLSFSNIASVYQAFTFLKDFAVPEVHCWKKMVPHDYTRTVEADFIKFEQALFRSELHFAEKFQLLALVFEGTMIPAKTEELIPYVSLMSRKHGAKLTASAISKLGRQIPTPGPHVDSADFRIATIQETLEANIVDAHKAEATYNTLHGNRKSQEHLALTYKATVTPTGM
jgi:hypothetical protein